MTSPGSTCATSAPHSDVSTTENRSERICLKLLRSGDDRVYNVKHQTCPQKLRCWSGEATRRRHERCPRGLCSGRSPARHKARCEQPEAVTRGRGHSPLPRQEAGKVPCSLTRKLTLKSERSRQQRLQYSSATGHVKRAAVSLPTAATAAVTTRPVRPCENRAASLGHPPLPGDTRTGPQAAQPRRGRTATPQPAAARPPRHGQ